MHAALFWIRFLSVLPIGTLTVAILIGRVSGAPEQLDKYE